MKQRRYIYGKNPDTSSVIHFPNEKIMDQEPQDKDRHERSMEDWRTVFQVTENRTR